MGHTILFVLWKAVMFASYDQFTKQSYPTIYMETENWEIIYTRRYLKPVKYTNFLMQKVTKI